MGWPARSGFVSQALCLEGAERTPWFQDGMASRRTVGAGRENGAGPAGSSGTLMSAARASGLRRLLGAKDCPWPSLRS